MIFKAIEERCVGVESSIKFKGFENRFIFFSKLIDKLIVLLLNITLNLRHRQSLEFESKIEKDFSCHVLKNKDKCKDNESVAF
jgi:hypothetical protein